MPVQVKCKILTLHIASTTFTNELASVIIPISEIITLVATNLIASTTSRVLALVKNSAVDTAFPIWSITEDPKLCFSNPE